jgi:hypothetical protein
MVLKSKNLYCHSVGKIKNKDFLFASLTLFSKSSVQILKIPTKNRLLSEYPPESSLCIFTDFSQGDCTL